MVHDTYGDTGDEIVLVVASSSVSALAEHDDEWNLGEILLLRLAYIRARLRVVFR